MNRHLISAILFLLSCQLFSQSVNQIIINSPLSVQHILPGDVAVGNFDGNSYSGGCVIGYSFRDNTPRPVIGILGIQDNGAIQYSQNFTISGQELLEVKKITTRGPTDAIYVLASLQNTLTLEFMPVVLVLDRATGNLLNQYYLNVPHNDATFFPTDIIFDHSSHLLILCVGTGLRVAPGTNRSALYLIDFDLQTITYSCTRITNPANLTADYGPDFSFIRDYHSGSFVCQNLSFYGIERSSSFGINQGIVFVRDHLNQNRCFTFSINNSSIYSIQVNGSTTQPTIAMQNSIGQIYMENSDYLANIFWSKKLSRNSPLFYLYGMGHGAKAGGFFFTGQYAQPGATESGYSFLKYDPYTGNILQAYNFDLNIDQGWANGFGYARNYVDDRIYKYHFIGESISMPNLPRQYFYYINNAMGGYPTYIDPTNCATQFRFDEDNFPVSREPVSLNFDTYVTNLIPSNPNISAINIPFPTVQPICADQGSKTSISEEPGSEKTEKIYDTLTINGLINRYLHQASQSKFITVSKYPSEIDVKKNSQFFILEAKNKRIIGGNIFNATGQLIKKLSKTNSKTIQITKEDFKFHQVGFVQIIFDDGSIETEKIVF